MQESLKAAVTWARTRSSELGLPESLFAETDIHVLFAGGIHDARSAALVGVMAAPLTERGMRVGVLMGTAYLFTREIVDCGAVVRRYQDEAVRCTRTVNLETAPGHASRCAVTPFAHDFLAERHLASLTVLRADGSPHVTAVGTTWDDEAGLLRVITWAGAVKARLLSASDGGRASVCQIDGGRWLTMEGDAVVTDDPQRCAEGLRRYAERYRPPYDRGADRRVIEITVDRVMGRA